MILAVLDDLMFTSKIKTTARQLGLPVSFARTSDGALDAIRSSRPTVVLFDLNNPRTDPLGTVSRMKADAGMADIPTVGFVSHVQADLIAAARAAGFDDVMARSAFSEHLPD